MTHQEIQPERRSTFTIDRGEISIVKATVALAAILGFGWGVVTTIVLPINSMQVQLAQIQLTLKTQSQNFLTLQTQVTLDNNNILILQQQVNQLNGTAVAK